MVRLRRAAAGGRRKRRRSSRKLQTLQIRLQQERAEAQRTDNLRQLLELRERAQLDTTAAEVIAGPASPEFQTVTIDKGSSDGLATDMAVISPAGVVGRVILPSRRASKVQLLIDRNAAAGALIERTRVQGVVVGVGSGMLRMQYVPGTADVKTGDLVVTSGIDGIYPKGFVIGTIDHVGRRRWRVSRDQRAAGGGFLAARGSADRAHAAARLAERPRVAVRSAAAFAAIFIALAAQTTLAGYVFRSSTPIDLVLIVGGVCGDQVRSGDGRAGRHRGGADSGRAVGGHPRALAAWPRPWSASCRACWARSSS